MTESASPEFSREQLDALARHRFPGGRYRIERWENWLLTDCTGREPMPDGLVHPIALFHVPILGVGTSIAELFRLGGASGAGGSVGLLGYDWEYLEPLREEVDYALRGGVVETERLESASGRLEDRVAFGIEVLDGDQVVARVTNRWSFRRSPPRPSSGARHSSDPTSPMVVTGEQLPPWVVESVDPARMKTMAALLRDPYPVHWDRSGNERLGLGGRVINQGPLNLGYVANMLMQWAGSASVRRLTVAFGRPVLDGDRVVAGGCVTSETDGVAACEVWLDRDGERVVTGTAEVALSSPADPRS